MKLPFQNRLIIEESKIRNYLLDTLHHSGADKAAFFVSHSCNVFSLKEIILKQAKDEEYTIKFETLFGEKYILESSVIMPDSKVIVLRSVWIVLDGTNFVKFVTAYPIK